MFSIKAEPTFEATLTIKGQGREQKLKVTFRHRKSSEFAALLDSIQKGETTSEAALLSVIESWDADMPLSVESLALLKDEQPGADWAILSGFGEALTVARTGN